jgi:hypothetical protein
MGEDGGQFRCCIRCAEHCQSSDTTLRVTSRETVMDVTVTDAKGRAIHGLKQYDFVVKEDGKPQPVRSFQEFSETTPPARQSNSQTGAVPAEDGPGTGIDGGSGRNDLGAWRTSTLKD